MRKSLTTFAGILAAAGLLSFGSISVGQDTAESGATPPPAATEQAPENISDPSSDNADNADAARDAADGNAESSDNSFMENSNESTQSDASEQNSSTSSDASAEAPEATTDDQQESNTSQQNADQQDAEQTADDRQSEAKQDADDQNDQEAENKDDKSKSDNQQDMNTPPVPDQARDSQANSNAPRDADWRMVGYQNQWWYYSPQGQWMVRQGNQWRPYQSANLGSQRTYNDSRMMTNRQAPQRYSTGYRGTDESQAMNSQPMAGNQSAAQLRYDRCGRAFICENGRRVYLQVDDQGQSNTSNNDSTSDAQPTMADDSNAPSRSASSSNDMSGDSDDLGRPTPARDEMRSVPPAPPTAE